MFLVKILFPVFFLLLGFSCSNEKKTSNQTPKKEQQKIIVEKHYDVELIRSFPHSIDAYTQGLYYYNDILYESTGQRGFSTVRKINPENGDVLELAPLEDEYFAEGITIMDDKLYLLTWESRVGFVYDPQTLQRERTFTFGGEGWGLTDNDSLLIMSNGSNELRYLNTRTFRIENTIFIQYRSSNVRGINEMEYVNGSVFANIYGDNRIVEIDPETGEIIALIDLSFLLNEIENKKNLDVLNGIAYNSKTGTFYVTGKYWPKMFEIRITEK